ncbi:MAG: helix-turn-helix transcriptional regulator [Alphaproteobacteria bacterium]
MSGKVTEAEAAETLAALGNPTRLGLFRLLIRAGLEGLNVSEIQARTDIPASTLAHHLAALARAGVIHQEKRGRELICTASYERVRALAAYLTEDCCAGVAGRARRTAPAEAG